MPAPGAMTQPLVARAEAEAEQHRRGLQESREAIAALSERAEMRSHVG